MQLKTEGNQGRQRSKDSALESTGEESCTDKTLERYRGTPGAASRV